MLLLFGQTQTVTMHNIRPVYCQCWKCGNNRVKLGWKGVKRRHIGLFYYSCPLIVVVQGAWGELSTPCRHVRKTRKFRCLIDVVLISSPKLSCNVCIFHLTSTKIYHFLTRHHPIAPFVLFKDENPCNHPDVNEKIWISVLRPFSHQTFTSFVVFVNQIRCLNKIFLHVYKENG